MCYNAKVANISLLVIISSAQYKIRYLPRHVGMLLSLHFPLGWQTKCAINVWVGGILYPEGHQTEQYEYIGTAPVAQKKGVIVTPGWSICSLGQVISERNKYLCLK